MRTCNGLVIKINVQDFANFLSRTIYITDSHLQLRLETFARVFIYT